MLFILICVSVALGIMELWFSVEVGVLAVGDLDLREGCVCVCGYCFRYRNSLVVP